MAGSSREAVVAVLTTVMIIRWYFCFLLLQFIKATRSKCSLVNIDKTVLSLAIEFLSDISVAQNGSHMVNKYSSDFFYLLILKIDFNYFSFSTRLIIKWISSQMPRLAFCIPLFYQSAAW